MLHRSRCPLTTTGVCREPLPLPSDPHGRNNCYWLLLQKDQPYSCPFKCCPSVIPVLHPLSYQILAAYPWAPVQSGDPARAPSWEPCKLDQHNWRSILQTKTLGRGAWAQGWQGSSLAAQHWTAYKPGVGQPPQVSLTGQNSTTWRRIDPPKLILEEVSVPGWGSHYTVLSQPVFVLMLLIFIKVLLLLMTMMTFSRNTAEPLSTIHMHWG